MRIEERRPESTEKISKRNIFIDDKKVGIVEIAFDLRIAQIANIDIDESQQKSGHGKNVIIQIGEELASRGISLHSGANISPAGIRLFESLVRDGRMQLVVHPKYANQQVYKYIPQS